MARTSGIALTALMIVCSASTAFAQNWSGEKTSIINDGMGSLVVVPPGGQPMTPSAVIGTSIGGKPVLMRGYGVATSDGKSATADTRYPVGSLSKQITAAAVLALMEEQGPFTSSGALPKGAKLTPGTLVEEIFPEASKWSKVGPIRVEQLLTMRSGFLNYTFDPPLPTPKAPDAAKPVSADALYEHISKLLTANPAKSLGGNSVYSNTNYFLLARVIEKATKPKNGPAMTYRDYIRKKVFEPAGMSVSGFVGESSPLTTASPTPNGTPLYDQPAWPMGAGEVTSTVGDILKWHRALMNNKILSANGVRKMLQPSGIFINGTPPIHYAMGWTVFTVDDFTWYSHDGFIDGYSAFDGIYVNNKTKQWTSVVVLTNQDNLKTLGIPGACAAQLAMDNSTTQEGLGAGTKAVCFQG